MYRELASLDAFGVPGGPYTGTPRTFRYRDLPEAVRTRLARCISREELPSPLLTVSMRRPRFVYALAAAVVAALPWLWAATLSPTRIAPMGWIACFVVPYAIAGWLLQQSFRKDHLNAGVYLFPLDIVEAYGETVRITPLGSLRNAGIARAGAAHAGGLFLELRFDHGASYRFGCADDASAESAYAKICEAHAAVERVTFGRDLEETVDMDPFFAIRGEPVWATASAIPSRAPLVRNARGVAAGVLGGALAFAVVAARGDHALYRDAVATHAAADYRAYLAAGGRLHRHQAEYALRVLQDAENTHRDFVERERAARALPDPTHRPDAELDAEQIAVRVDHQIAAHVRYATKIAGSLDATGAKWPRHLPVPEILDDIFRAAREHGDDGLYFDFRLQREGSIPPAQQAMLEHAVRSREERVMHAFAQVLSQTIPANVLVVARLDRASSEPPALVVHVAEHVTVRSALDFDVDFAVSPSRYGQPTDAHFELSMPAPRTRITQRPHSLFSLPEREAGPARDIDLVTARAFDRLYDELYSLFFPGDPVVPLATTDEFK